jgi:hypothetical protein
MSSNKITLLGLLDPEDESTPIHRNVGGDTLSHSVTSQKTRIFRYTSERTSNAPPQISKLSVWPVSDPWPKPTELHKQVALRYKPEGRGFDSRCGHWDRLQSSGSIMALALTQPLTEMSTISPWGGVRRLVRTADNLTTFMCRLSRNSGSLNLLTPYGPVQACNGITLPFT